MTDEDDGVSLLDEEGRLFGVVNIVDALVVLLVLAVVVAGVALLFPGGSEEQETRFATVELGTQPAFVAEQITPGDSWEPEGTSDEMVITDVYRFETEGGIGVTIRGRVNGTATDPADPAEDPVFEFLGDPLQLGQTIEMTTDDYQVSGNITRVQRSGESLPTQESGFVLETTVDDSLADNIATGDTFSIAGGRLLATIESVQRFPRDDGQYLLLGIRGTTITDGGSQLFGNTEISAGASVTFASDTYRVTGSVLQPRMGMVDRTDRRVIIETTVGAETIDQISVGDSYRVGGEPVATVESRVVYPTGDPETGRLLLGLTLRTNEQEATPQFAGRPVRLGATVPFQTEAYDFTGEILQRGTAAVNQTDQQVVVRTTVPPETGDQISVGDSYRVGGEPVATVESRTVYQTNAPDTRRALLGLSLRTNERGGTVRFAGQPVRVGAAVPFETETYSFTGEILQRGSLEQPGRETTRTITLGVDNIRPERAASLRVGATEETGPLTTAAVLEKASEPAQVILTSEGGDIFQREHPRNLDVELTVELTVRELDDGTLRFRGSPLRSGESLTLNFDELRVTGEIFAIEDAGAGTGTG